MHQGVQALPVSFNLGGDVFILQDDTSYPALPPFCGRGKNQADMMVREGKGTNRLYALLAQVTTGQTSL